MKMRRKRWWRGSAGKFPDRTAPRKVKNQAYEYENMSIGAEIPWGLPILRFRSRDRWNNPGPRGMLRVGRQPSGHPRRSCHLRSPTQIHAALSLSRYGTPRYHRYRRYDSHGLLRRVSHRGRAGEVITNIMRAEVTRTERKKQSKRRRGEARSERVEARDFYASPRNKTKERERERDTGDEGREKERGESIFGT